jgi:signal peptidase II
MNPDTERWNARVMGNRFVKLILIAGCICIVDQLIKAIIVNSLPLYQTITVIPGLFNLTHIQNPGGAFGFLSGNSSQLRHIFFLVSSLAAMGLVIYLYAKMPPGYRFLESGFALILGGAIGNAVDRIRVGKVVDFLDFHIQDLHWPAFNLADSTIVIGIIIFVYHLLFKKLPE